MFRHQVVCAQAGEDQIPRLGLHVLPFGLTFGCCLVQQGRDIWGLIGPILVGPPLQSDREICILHSWNGALLEWSYLGRALVCESSDLGAGIGSVWNPVWVPQVFRWALCGFRGISIAIRCMSGDYL